MQTVRGNHLLEKDPVHVGIQTIDGNWFVSSILKFCIFQQPVTFGERLNIGVVLPLIVLDSFAVGYVGENFANIVIKPNHTNIVHNFYALSFYLHLYFSLNRAAE